MASKKTKEESVNINESLAAMLNANKELHLNSEEDCAPYRISSGSLKLDHVLDGGFGPGMHRFVGTTEGGKTSETFVVMSNFFKKFSTARGIYVKAEGRLTEDMKRRSGIKFVSKPADWVDGTCFILESTIYEFVARVITTTLLEDKTRRYCIIIDAIDGLIATGDMDKDYGEAMKVGGPAVLSKLMMKRLSPYINKFGHQLFIISQKSADIKLDPYALADPRLISGTGGNAMLHYSNTILEFGHRTGGDHILKDDKEKPDPMTNPILGHLVTITIKKSENESSNYRVKYPIKRGKVGCAVWIEREIFEMLIGWGLLNKKGAWFNFESELIEEMKRREAELTSDTIQGETKVMKYLEDNPVVVDRLREYLLELINKQ